MLPPGATHRRAKRVSIVASCKPPPVEYSERGKRVVRSAPDSVDWEIECELSSEAAVVVRVICEQHDHEDEYRFTLDEVIAAVASDDGQNG